MASTPQSRPIAAAPAATRTAPAASLRFDWAATALAVWLIGGLYLDGWAHRHGRVDNTFFTPWHAVLYAGATVLMLFLALSQGRQLARGDDWRHALPPGYLLALLGAGLFVLGGGLDLVWHQLFGVEVNLEALLSPTHLLLAFGGSLMATGPLRAAWQRPAAPAPGGWFTLGPLVVSALLFLSVLTFFTTFVHPLDVDLASAWEAEQPAWLSESVGLAGLLLQAAFLAGVVLPLARRFSLPFGALTVIIGVNSLLMAVFQDRYGLALAAVAAGLLADVLYARLRPAAGRARFYVFAATLPVLVSGSYFLALAASTGIAWTIHLWLGSILLTGFVGLFIALLLQSAAPPKAMS